MEKQAAGLRDHFIFSIKISFLVGIISYALRYATLFYSDITDWTLILSPLNSFFSFFFTAGIAFWITFLVFRFNRIVAAITFAGVMAGIRILTHFDNAIATPLPLIIVEMVVFAIHLFAYLMVSTWVKKL